MRAEYIKRTIYHNVAPEPIKFVRSSSDTSPISVYEFRGQFWCHSFALSQWFSEVVR